MLSGILASVQLRGLESDKVSLSQDLAAQQQSVASKMADLQKQAQELAAAQSERHSAQQQVIPKCLGRPCSPLVFTGT